jgi:hypothetical protein
MQTTSLSDALTGTQQVTYCPLIHLNDIDTTISCHPPSSRSNDPITRAAESLNAPPPKKFDRKAKKTKTCGTAPKTSKSIEYVHVDWEGVYRSHRQYVQSLIMESDILPESASDFPDTWSVCESIFVIK